MKDETEIYRLEETTIQEILSEIGDYIRCNKIISNFYKKSRLIGSAKPTATTYGEAFPTIVPYTYSPEDFINIHPITLIQLGFHLDTQGKAGLYRIIN